jgi:hypothetical protein
MDELTPAEPLRTSVPAWGLSLVVHLVLLIGVALVVPSTTDPRGLTETPRTAAIVLVENKADAPTRYLDEAAASELSQPVEQSLAHAAVEATAEATLEEPLVDLLPAAPSPALPPADIGRALSEFKTAGRAAPQRQAAADAEAKLIAGEQALFAEDIPSGPSAKVAIFGSAPAEGRSFTFVIDRSSSMGEEGLAVLGVASEQLEAAINALGPTHRFQIVAYNQRPTAIGPKKMTLATDENKQLVRPFLMTIGAYGGTDHELALVGALAAKPDVLFLHTDGGDPFLTAPEFRRLVEMAGRRTTIHCIQFGQGPPAAGGEIFMRRLASATGGSFTYVDVDK